MTTKESSSCLQKGCVICGSKWHYLPACPDQKATAASRESEAPSERQVLQAPWGLRVLMENLAHEGQPAETGGTARMAQTARTGNQAP